MTEHSHPLGNDIAVIGFAFKLPQNVNDVASFWDVLQNRKNLMTPWPASRINADSFVSGKRSQFKCRGGHFIDDDPAAFDAPFFGISTKEAAALDPMQRWTLETSYHAFENAGIPSEKIKGSKTSVFSASFTDDWAKMTSQDPDSAERTAGTGQASSLISNRVSWYFDLRGPSVHIDTACSSSLFALDMACQSLRAGESSMALVTGSSLILNPTITNYLSNLGFLSPDSKCYSFDRRANGYARGEGFVALLLKPVFDAIQDGDMIRAIVRATGSNQDGLTPSITHPSPRAQEDLIRHVYSKAKLSLDKTRYVEAHGTGTPVGDPIEMKAIGRVFRSCRSTEEPLYVGSVKTNVGHLEGSSGLAGVVKSIISLEKGIIPPLALFETINPDIDLEFYHTAIPTKEVAWPSKGLRRTSLNSFGFGGTNSHTVLDDAYHYMKERGLTGNHCTLVPDHNIGESLATLSKFSPIHGSTNGDNNGDGGKVANHRLLVWSAADEKAAKRQQEQHQAFFQEHIGRDQAKIDQFAYTLAARRSRMLWRSSAVVTNSLSNCVNLSVSKPVRSSAETGLAFVFTGQGAQYADMGWDLIREYPLFSKTMERIDDVYQALGCPWHLLDELRNPEHIDRPEYSQPLSTALQLALIELFRSFEIVPKVVIGHSSGEIAAAYAIGALSMESACKVSYFRGQLAGNLRLASSPAGAMISINLPETEVPAYLDRLDATGVSLACINSPSNCTLSGPERGIDAVKEQADKDSIFAQKLKTGVAYHSSAMLAVVDEYKTQMGTLEGSKSTTSIPMISTVTGTNIRPDVLATAQYWADNMISPVQFAGAIHSLTQQASTWKAGFLGSVTDLVEIGPTAALRRPIMDTLAKSGARAKQVRYLSALYRKRSAVETMLECVGQLFSHGYPVSIKAVNQLDGSGPFLVDCPEYPFDHSTKYWSESRISRDYRLRGAVFGETLGQRATDWNPLKPRWRNFWSVESDPWIADHKISDTVIFPATGMMIMAMEALLQTVPADRTVAGYFIKEARFLNPIVVGEAWEDKTETIVELRPLQKSHEKDSARSEVHVFSYRNKEWSECFWAHLQVQYEDELLQSGVQREKTLLENDILSRYRSALEVCRRPVDSQVFYRNAIDHGLHYGDSFQLLEGLHWDGIKNAVARIDVSKLKFSTTSLVHPAVLDTVLHMLRASSQANASSSATNVPVKLLNAWFSASGWQSPRTGSIHCWGRANVDQSAGEDGSIYAIGDDGHVLMSVEHLVTVAVSRLDGADAATKRLLHRVQRKPQLSLLDSQQLRLACVRGRIVKDEVAVVTRQTDLESVMNLALSRTLRTMTPEERGKLPATLERHWAWMEQHVSALGPSQRDNPDDPISDEDLEQRLQHIEKSHEPWKLQTEVVRQLKNILLGDKDPLEVIFGSSLADDYYADMFAETCDARLHAFLELAAHENPGLRILEVGAGTGAFTGQVLNTLQSLEKANGGLKLAEYTYTDISPTFFERARERWKGLEGRIHFQTLDLERSLESQGFDVGSYDLLVAGSVLHATTDITNTLKNVRTALKPGGKAVIFEVVASHPLTLNFSFGLVPGWWLAQEEWRMFSPLLDEKQWHACLRDSGYSGNDLVLQDYEDDRCHLCSIIISTAVEEVALPVVASKVIILVEGGSQLQSDLATHIRDSLEMLRCGFSDHVLVQKRSHDIEVSSDDVVLCLASLDTPWLSEMTDEKLAWIKTLLRRAKRLLWVSMTSTENPRLPFHSQQLGFFRSLRLEAADSHIVTLAVESQGVTEVLSCTQHILKVLKASFLGSPSNELEYWVGDGLLETSRVTEDVEGNKSLGALLSPQLRDKALSGGPALALSSTAVGTLDSFCFIEDTMHEADLQDNEVEIEAKAWGVNFRDVMQALGRLDEGTLGVDCTGVVTRVGKDCNGALQIGDRVCMLTPGCMRQYPRARGTSVIKIPREDISFAAAAAFLVPGMTAFHALINVARVAKGETVLIHSAAGSTGQMAIAVARARGAVVYATVGSEEKKRFLVDVLGVPKDHIFHSRNTSFAHGIMRVTNGRGVDVVLNSLSGEALTASWECMARQGRFIEIGKVDIKANSGLPMAHFARNVSFAAVDLQEILVEDPRLTAELLEKTMQFVLGTNATPRPLHLFPASQVEQAFRTLQGGMHIGRIVIEPNGDDIVPQYLLDRRPWRFNSDASYLVAGGFGGIGREILRWMATRGARYLIVPSRSGASSKAAIEVMAELQSRGIQVKAPKCDVASELALAAVLEEFASTMPPVRGCIDAALVLQDALFENMTLTQWEGAVQAKVDTAWNLHRLLPNDLDFFILLSSLAGQLGQMASSNYAGGCTFQDALARLRVEQGRKGASIDIGWMRDIGIVAETASFQRQRLTTQDMQQVDGRELMALLTILCDPDASPMTADESQVLVGLRTPAEFLAKDQAPPALLDRPLFASFARVAGTSPTPHMGAAADPAALFRAAADAEGKVRVVLESLVAKLARAMSISPGDVELSQPLSSYGVDSLMAVELRNWIGRDFGAPVAVFDIMGGVPISSVGELVVARSTIGGSKS